MYNIDVRTAIKQAGLFGYMVAAAIGVSETYFSRQLSRSELSDEKKQQILYAIKNLTTERAKC